MEASIMPSEDVDQSYLKRRQGAADDELARRILAVHPELAPQGADGQAGASNEASAPQRTSVLEMKPPQSPEEAERQRQQIEGAAPELQPTMGPVEGGISSGAAPSICWRCRSASSGDC